MDDTQSNPELWVKLVESQSLNAHGHQQISCVSRNVSLSSICLVGWKDGDGCLTTRLPGRCGGRNTYAPDYLIEGKSLLEWYLGVVLKLAIRVLLKQKLAPTHHNKTSL